MAILLNFWLTMVQRAKEGLSLESKVPSWWKFFFTLFISLDIVFFYTIYLFEIEGEPHEDYFTVKSTLFISLLGSTIGLTAIFTIWYLISMITSLKQFKTFPLRHKIIFISNNIALILSICGLLVGAFTPFNNEAGVYLFFKGFLNFYIILLMVLYSPSERAIQHADEFREIYSDPTPLTSAA